MSKSFETALCMFAKASSKPEYAAAKRFAAKLDPIEQLAIIDSLRAARSRIMGAV